VKIIKDVPCIHLVIYDIHILLRIFKMIYSFLPWVIKLPTCEYYSNVKLERMVNYKSDRNDFLNILIKYKFN